MQVPRRAAFRVKGIFQNEQPAAILRDDLEVNGTDAEPAVLTKSVFACPGPQYKRKMGYWLQEFVRLMPPSVGSCDIGLTVDCLSRPVGCPVPVVLNMPHRQPGQQAH